jgi:hypothetical protein
VALSITYHEDSHLLRLEVKKLRRYLDDDITILIGGQGAASLSGFLDGPEMQILRDVDSFRIAIGKLRKLQDG